MDLLRRIAISNGDSNRKDAATAAMAQEDQQIIARWNKELEDELWQKILDRIERRGYAGVGKNAANPEWVTSAANFSGHYLIN